MSSGNSSSITNYNYKVTVKDWQYTIIGENIRKDFDFIIDKIPEKLQEALKNLEDVAAINDAFYIESTNVVSDLSHVYDEIKEGIEKAKQMSETLHGNFIDAIQNVNKELRNNFGWEYIGKGKHVYAKNDTDKSA